MIIQIHDTPIINDIDTDIRQRRLLRVSHWGKPASLQSGVAKRCKAAVTESLEDDDGNAFFLVDVIILVKITIMKDKYMMMMSMIMWLKENDDDGRKSDMITNRKAVLKNLKPDDCKW